MQTDIIASTHLGKKSIGSQNYDPSLLVSVPREENRRIYGINNNKLPFCGYDVWHAYEFSCLTEKGLPITRVLKLKYNCDSEFIVESKSLKLYLNSFNMTRLGNTTKECLKLSKQLIESDLSEKLKTKVLVNYLDNNSSRIYENYKNIMDYIDEISFETNLFKESPELLRTKKTEYSKEYRIMFDSLRSNCRVTHQPDFGDIFVYYKSKKHIIEESLLKYLVSFRSEFHFHEECCEMIFKRVSDILDFDDELMVCALYTRRGGIDICPVRYSKNCSCNDFEQLIDINIYARYGIKQ